MLHRLRHNHSAVAAYLALFVALSGTAYAAATITGDDVVDGSLTGADIQGQPASSGVPAVNGSITTYDIQDGTLRSNDILNNSIGGGKIADRSIKVADLGADSVTSTQIADKSLSGLDLDGDTVTGENIVESSLGEVPNAAHAGVRVMGTVVVKSARTGSEPVKDAIARCQYGHALTGGGYAVEDDSSGSSPDLNVTTARPFGNEFRVNAVETSGWTGNWHLLVYAVCLDA